MKFEELKKRKKELLEGMDKDFKLMHSNFNRLIQQAMLKNMEMQEIQNELDKLMDFSQIQTTTNKEVEEYSGKKKTKENIFDKDNERKRIKSSSKVRKRR